MSSQEINFPVSKIASSEAGLTTIQQALVGPIVVNQIKLNNFKGSFNYVSGTMKNTQLKVDVGFYISYWVGICIDLGFDTYCLSKEGTEVGIGSVSSGWFGVGDLSIDPGTLSLDIAQTTFGPFAISSLSIGGKEQQPLTVSSMKANGISMKNTSMHTGLPSVLGLDLPVPNPMGPQSVNTETVNMRQFVTEGIRVPPMEFIDVQASNIKMDSVESAGFEAGGGKKIYSNWANFGIAKFQLIVQVNSHIKCSKLKMQDLSGNVHVGSVQSSGFTMSMSLNGINISGLKINGFEVPTIELEV
ncbi:MAG: hypothetical protein M1503_06890 [Thaumarchaeota archaeon]|nr:hypothetical protein [Nitrososphaerota archaeon]MCL5317969.1 hypothetical protein [Nitrososphaerota archaeon]